MKNPFFSVIIPTLNEERYLPKLLASLTCQQFTRFEVIVVDGKSKDRTVAIAKRYEASLPHLTILASDKQNVAYQRNMGAAQARGKFLVFLDADVITPEEYLGVVYKAVMKKRIRIATTWYKPDTADPMDEFMTSIGNIMMDVAKLIDRPFAGGWNTIIRRDIFKKLHGYAEGLKIAEDHDLVLRAADAGSELTVIRDVKITFCMRRFRHYGYFKSIRTYATTSLHALINNAVVDESIDYPMGGHRYPKRKKSKKKLEVNALLRKMLEN